mgnify:CR=1 FL=1
MNIFTWEYVRQTQNHITLYFNHLFFLSGSNKTSFTIIVYLALCNNVGFPMSDSKDILAAAICSTSGSVLQSSNNHKIYNKTKWPLWMNIITSECVALILLRRVHYLSKYQDRLCMLENQQYRCIINIISSKYVRKHESCSKISVWFVLISVMIYHVQSHSDDPVLT